MSTKIIKAGFLVGVAGIKTPDNFAALLAMPRIKRLAASIKSVSQIAPVVLQKVGDGYKLWAGHDRLAAVTLAGHARIRADIREGRDADFLLLQIAENDERRPIGELIDEYREADNKFLPSDVNPRKSTTYTKSATARQDGEIADARGVSPDAERKRRERTAAAQQRAAAVERQRAEDTSDGPTPLIAGGVQPGAELLALPDGFNAFGLDVPNEHRERVQTLTAALMEWDRATRKVLTELSRLEKVTNPPLISRQAAESIRDKAHALGHVIREAIPTSLCFYCKNDDRSVVNCPACGGTGLGGRHAGDNVPPELKLGGDKARIALDGKFVLVSGKVQVPNMAGGKTTVTKGFAVAAEKAVAKRRGVRVVAVDESGHETDIPLDDVPPPDDDQELAF